MRSDSSLRIPHITPEKSPGDFIMKNHDNAQLHAAPVSLISPGYQNFKKEEDKSQGEEVEGVIPPSSYVDQTEELQEENQYLEEIIDQLESEKNALKLRLNETQYYDRFDVANCKKWLQGNFEFDRKDTPELLATIFESYLMQDDNVDVLPHQLLVKNSTRARNRREKRNLERMKLLTSRKEKYGVDTITNSAVKKGSSNGGSDSTSSHLRSSSISKTSGTNSFASLTPNDLDELYDTEPWSFYITTWPKPSKAKNSKETSEVLNAIKSITQKQHQFLQEHAWALWERGHWFPLRSQSGERTYRNGSFSRHHGRRKRRQALLKEQLEKLSDQMKRKFSGLNIDSIFSDQSIERIMARPRPWVPETGVPLLDQLIAVDMLDRERNYNLKKP
uniref:AlNc14C10G1253 protein n=1 Tax=Albugo laibachii Nc14 TaxID=890382 RepID=F0W2K6_9STRA|nr:AlNc14C10G1253 [Albugo laibachii Nc14]|eukprot:CCA15292.1 AlNc14C10G1253 [Albugo laibachii Nc14]